MSGLPGESTLYFAVRAIDEVGNVGALSETVSGVSSDGRPGQIKDLTAGSTTKYGTTLSWTAPGDDGYRGAASGFEIRYATWPTTLETVPFAMSVQGPPAPKVNGARQSHTVLGLETGTKYNFAVIAKDEKRSASYLSNLAVAETEPEPDHRDGLFRWTSRSR